MRTKRRGLSTLLHPGAVLGLALGLALPPVGAASAAPASEDILYRSSHLMIYRATSTRGVPVVVLTNLDDQGNPFSPPGGGPDEREDAARPQAPQREPESGAPAAAAPGPGEAPPAGAVKVVVNQGGGEQAIDDQNVEVTTDGTGGTTVIININPPASPEKERLVVPVAYPVLAVGGLPGPFRYPEDHHFLGYGPGISSPSLFSGLGLHSGNRFGSKYGVSCDKGYDCLFAPSSQRP